MLALANPRPAATSGGRCRPPRSRRSSTLLPSHLLSGYANGPDAGHAPSRLMRAMTAASTRGSHHGGSGAGCGVVGASAEEEEEDGEADGSAAAAASSFENVFLGGCGYNGDEDDDDDAIPLVALSGAQVRAKTTGVGKMKGRMMMEQQEPDDDDQQQQQQQQKENGRRRKRVYRYVSHGIGGAGNFRRVLTSFRSDVTTTDPSFARNHHQAAKSQQQQRQASSGPDPGPSSTICACSRCFSSGSSGKNVPSTGSGASGRTSTAGSGSATARA